MKYQFSRAIIVLMLLICPMVLVAQFSMSGEFRPRAELSHGYKALAAEDQDASLITSQRTRLNLNFKNEYLQSKLVLQDVRQWGNQPQLVANEDKSISVHEAWADIMLNEKWSLKAGRQELVYDDHRIFGNVGWAQQARSHDVALFKYKGDLDLHIGLAAHQNSLITNSDYDGPDAYKSLQFLWLHKELDNSAFSFLFLNNGVPFNTIDGQETNYSQTIGGRYTAKFGGLGFAGNLYVQSGKDAIDVKINAYNLLLEINGKVGEGMSLTGGAEILSGTSWDDTKNKSFTPLYGTNHKFNGYMDYFYVGNHIGSVGLRDIYGKLTYNKSDITYGADLHIFSSAAELNADSDNYLGTELDLSVTWKFKPMVNFNFGWSAMMGSDSMVALKGGSTDSFSHWGYVMISVTPDFIK